jgi:hypothetical protein
MANPAQNLITIEYESAENLEALPTEINFINEKKLIKEKNIKLKDIYDKENLKLFKIHSIDVSKLERGLYFLEFTYSNRKENPKEVVKILLN